MFMSFIPNSNIRNVTRQFSLSSNIQENKEQLVIVILKVCVGKDVKFYVYRDGNQIKRKTSHSKIRSTKAQTFFLDLRVAKEGS